jgi:hypothetical protein
MARERHADVNAALQQKPFCLVRLSAHRMLSASVVHKRRRMKENRRRIRRREPLLSCEVSDMNGFERSNNSGRTPALLAGTVYMTDMSDPGILQPLLGLEQKRDAVLKELNGDVTRWLQPARSLLFSFWRSTVRSALGYLARSRQRQIETMLP